MTDLERMFGIDDYDGDHIVRAQSPEQAGEAVDEICAGLLDAGCAKDDVCVQWWPNAPDKRTDICVKGRLRYRIVLDT